MRRWVPLAAIAGLLAWTALATPWSVEIGEYLAYYDPQSDAEFLEYHRDLAAHVYTAGHWVGQLVAALGGAWLVARSGPFRWSTYVWSALAGVVLGLVTGTVAIVAGLRVMHTDGYPSVAPDPTMLADPAVRWCLLASLLCFPLWAVLGAAIARLRAERRLLVVAGTVLVQPLTVWVYLGALAPPSSHPLAVSMIADAGPAALFLPAILLVWVAVATTVASFSSRRRHRS